MKRLCAILLALCIMLGMSACASVFTKEYYWSQSYSDQSQEYSGEEREIKSYSMLRTALMRMVEKGEESASFRFGSYSGSLIDDLAAVCVEVKNETPLGAYAVEDISYDTSRIVSYYTADISIRYSVSAEDIASVVVVSGLGEFGEHIRSAMASGTGKTVVEVYSSAVNEEYILGLVEEYYYAEPTLTVVLPKVRVSGYPESGTERIYEISFDYGDAAEGLEAMKAELLSEIEDLAAQVGEGDELGKALRCARLLSALPAGSALYADTAYGAIVEGGREPMGLALGYKVLCDRVGVECIVVRGETSEGGMRGHAWNIIGIGGEYYHVDISRFADSPEKSFLLSDGDIWGDYFWVKEDYPACAGALGPEDVFQPEVEEQPAVSGNVGAAETETPPVESEPPQAEETPQPSPEASPEPTPEGEGGTEESSPAEPEEPLPEESEIN